MVNIKSKTIFSKFSRFSRIPIVPTDKSEKDIERKNISYWLEKLFIQREKIRTDKNRRDEQIKIDIRRQPLGEPALPANHSAERGAQNVIKKDQDLTQSGINEYTKNIATKKEVDIQEVNDLVKKSNRSIIRISSFFPLDLFPNTIDVEESRVIFRFNQLLSSQSHSVDIKDISNVFLDSSIFFASLQVVSRTYTQNEIKIGKLNIDKAKKVQRVIEGLRTFAEHKISTSNYNIDELISKIEEFHTGDAIEKLN